MKGFVSRHQRIDNGKKFPAAVSFFLVDQRVGGRKRSQCLLAAGACPCMSNFLNETEEAQQASERRSLHILSKRSLVNFTSLKEIII